MNDISHEHILSLGRIVAAMARKQPERIEHSVEECRLIDIEPSLVHEAILQSYLFLGYPAALEALKIAARVYQHHWQIPASDGGIDSIATGQQVAQNVYGNALEKLLLNVEELSPTLGHQMMYEGYATILSRSGLELGIREILICMVLAETGYSTQLYSHVRGALRNGVSATALLAVAEDCCTKSAQTLIKSTLDKLQ